MRKKKYRALVSSDWNECLAPGGPFDPISFHYPDLTPVLKAVFKKYTSNRISFKEAISKIQTLIPSPITEEQMDVYIDSYFETYRGVPELIERLLSRGVLFMINTTGPQGYFQRLFAKKLLPRVPALSANPFIRYARRKSDPPQVYDLFETSDKPRNTEYVMNAAGISAEKVILIGDSGGDGPHFEWGRKTGAFLIGSMTKASLSKYCAKRNVVLNLSFGLSYAETSARVLKKEMEIDFMDLVPVIEERLNL